MTRNRTLLLKELRFYGIVAAPFLLSLYAIAVAWTDWARLSTLDVALANLFKFLPPNLWAIPALVRPALDTMLIAFLATVVIGILVPPVVWLAARNITPHFLAYVTGRGLIVLSRSVHELIWALLFVIAVGLGPLAGILALAMRGLGFVSKVVAEEIEAIDRGPIEAIRATGAGPLKVIILAVIPQILPIYLGTLIFQWELDLRRAAVVGVVGGGGLGLAFHQAMIQYQWRDAMAIVVVLVVIVALGEVASRRLRKQII